jgi:hypothetical protein
MFSSRNRRGLVDLEVGVKDACMLLNIAAIQQSLACGTWEAGRCVPGKGIEPFI